MQIQKSDSMIGTRWCCKQSNRHCRDQTNQPIPWSRVLTEKLL